MASVVGIQLHIYIQFLVYSPEFQMILQSRSVTSKLLFFKSILVLGLLTITKELTIISLTILLLS